MTEIGLGEKRRLASRNALRTVEFNETVIAQPEKALLSSDNTINRAVRGEVLGTTLDAGHGKKLRIPEPVKDFGVGTVEIAKKGLIGVLATGTALGAGLAEGLAEAALNGGNIWAPHHVGGNVGVHLLPSVWSHIGASLLAHPGITFAIAFFGIIKILVAAAIIYGIAYWITKIIQGITKEGRYQRERRKEEKG